MWRGVGLSLAHGCCQDGAEKKKDGKIVFFEEVVQTNEEVER